MNIQKLTFNYNNPKSFIAGRKNAANEEKASFYPLPKNPEYWQKLSFLGYQDILKPTKEACDIFKKDFLKSDETLTRTENVLVGSIPKLKQIKKGLNLSYPKRQFLYDLEKLNLNENDYRALKIRPSFSEKGSLKSYDGLLDINNIDKNTKLYKTCHRFLYENEVQTGDLELDRELNKIIKAIPEFLNTVSKVQSKGHGHTLDIHILLVLAQAIKDPCYKNLSNDDKAALKMSCLIHDIAKKGYNKDDSHPYNSAIASKKITPRFFREKQSQDRIFKLIKNHHWLEQWGTSDDKEKTAHKIASALKDKNDFEIEKILTRADISSVKEGFEEKCAPALADIYLIEQAFI